MQLSQQQLNQYQRDGFLIFPDLFCADEVDALRREADRVARIEADCIFREGDSGQAKSMFRLHEPDGPTSSAAFYALARSPRTLQIAQQILGDHELYLHHCKVNMKAAIQGSAWPWHQDFGSWHLDGIKLPDMATFMVMLHDASELGGCLYFLPGSHKEARQNPYFDTSTAYKLWAVGPEDMRRLMTQYPQPVALTGSAGTAAIFHCNLLHASGHNLSPVDRWQAYLCYNTVTNRPHDVENPRPDYVRSRNWTPLQLLDDDAITASAELAAQPA
jgi:ectoine hydroxylase